MGSPIRAVKTSTAGVWRASDRGHVGPLPEGEDSEIVQLSSSQQSGGDRYPSVSPFATPGPAGSAAFGPEDFYDLGSDLGSRSSYSPDLSAVAHADANLTALPEGMAPELAAGLGCRVTTAWQALVGRAGLKPGEWLAVFGGGGVGISALLLGRALGARVVVVDVVPEKLDYARALGADAVVNAAEEGSVDAVREITGGGAHVSVEALGIETTTVAAMRALRKLGRMVQIGMPAGDHAQMQLPMDVLYSGQLSVHGTRGMPSWRYPSLLNLIAGGHVDLSPLVTRTISLSQASDELAAFDRPAPPGVAVITDFLS